MKLSAAVPQEANFSLIGRFGNCLFGGAYGRGAPRDSGVTGYEPRRGGPRRPTGGRDQAWMWGDSPPQGLAGGTTCCSTRPRCPGSEPARSSIATLFASSRVKLPEIWPEPPVMGSRITGAEITLPSSTMANGFAIFSWVMWAKRRVPRPLKGNEPIGSFVALANPGPA